jgi:hypothetical protein
MESGDQIADPMLPLARDVPTVVAGHDSSSFDGWWLILFGGKRGHARLGMGFGEMRGARKE